MRLIIVAIALLTLAAASSVTAMVFLVEPPPKNDKHLRLPSNEECEVYRAFVDYASTYSFVVLQPEAAAPLVAKDIQRGSGSGRLLIQFHPLNSAGSAAITEQRAIQPFEMDVSEMFQQRASNEPTYLPSCFTERFSPRFANSKEVSDSIGKLSDNMIELYRWREYFRRSLFGPTMLYRLSVVKFASNGQSAIMIATHECILCGSSSIFLLKRGMSGWSVTGTHTLWVS